VLIDLSVFDFEHPIDLGDKGVLVGEVVVIEF
jgi:hypothetical protein